MATLRNSVYFVLLFISLADLSPAWAKTAHDLSYIQKMETKSKLLVREKKLKEGLAVLLGLSGLPELSSRPEASAGIFYNIACLYSLLKQKEKAIIWLNKAVDAGFGDIEHVKTDPDLQFFHEDPRFGSVIAKMKEAQRIWDGPTSIDTSEKYSNNLTDEEKIYGLSHVWSEVKYNFAFFDHVPNLNWDDLYVSSLKKVRETHSTVEYYRLLQAFVSPLRDGHTGVYPTSNELRRQVRSAPLISTRLIEGKVIVTKVFDDSLSSDGIKTGIEITKVNGQPVHDYVRTQVAPYVFASTSQGLEYESYDRLFLAGSNQETVQLSFQEEGGRVFDRRLPRFLSDERRKRMHPQDDFEFKILSGNVGYVRIDSFEDSKVVNQFEGNWNKINETRALIIDIRENGGGMSGVGYGILSHLTSKPFKHSAWKTREYHPAFRAWGVHEGWFKEEAMEEESDSKVYQKPVVVLIGPNTCSAAEDFVVAFDILKRGRLIGQTTSGSTGQPMVIALPGGMAARVCTKRDTYPDGKEFVGKGIFPNIQIPLTIKDVRDGKDAALNAALDSLKL